MKHHHDQHNPDHALPPHHGPYWKRAHQDWRFWIGVLLMLAAMMIYMGTGDFAWRPQLQHEQPASGPGAR